MGHKKSSTDRNDSHPTLAVRPDLASGVFPAAHVPNPADYLLPEDAHRPRPPFVHAIIVACVFMAGCGGGLETFVVVDHDPAPRAANVAVDAEIRVQFGEPMDPYTLTPETFALRHGGVAVEGDVISTPREAKFVPRVPLRPNAVYTAVVTTKVKYHDGASPTADYTWTFTTLDASGALTVAASPIGDRRGTLDPSRSTLGASVPPAQGPSNPTTPSAP